MTINRRNVMLAIIALVMVEIIGNVLTDIWRERRYGNSRGGNAPN